MRSILISIFILSVTACDEAKAPEAVETNNAVPPPPETVSAGADEAFQLTGELTSKSGRSLQYKQAFDAGHIVDVTACGNQLLTVTDGGRVVEWDPKTKKVKQVLRDFGAVTSIDSNEGVLLAGTADGRLLRSTCEGREPVAAPDPALPVYWVHLDVRSQKRAFVVFKEEANRVNKLPGTMANVALVDLETGRAAQEPFRRPWVDDANIFGFVDYRGELWFGMTPPDGKSTVWYLERFDDTQPSLAGLGDEAVHGFMQVSRKVWGFGGAVDRSRGFIYRVDSNRTKMLWDGEKRWFGERPGGELPTRPIVGMHMRGNDVVVLSSAHVFQTDKEFRRWKRFDANDPADDPLATATPTVEISDTIFVGTHRGLVALETGTWSRFVVPPSPTRSKPPALAKSVTWRGGEWQIGKRGRLEVTSDDKSVRTPRTRPKRVYGFFVDALDRLFVASSDGLWMFTGLAKGEQHHWDTTSLGIAGNVILGAGKGGKPDALEFSTTYGAHFRIRVPQGQGAE